MGLTAFALYQAPLGTPAPRHVYEPLSPAWVLLGRVDEGTVLSKYGLALQPDRFGLRWQGGVPPSTRLREPFAALFEGVQTANGKPLRVWVPKLAVQPWAMQVVPCVDVVDLASAWPLGQWRHSEWLVESQMGTE